MLISTAWREFSKTLNTIQIVVQPHRLMLLTGVSCLLVADSLVLFAPIQVGELMQDVRAVPFQRLLVLGAVMVAQSVFSTVGAYCLGLVAVASITDLRQKLFSGFMHAPVSFYDEHLAPGLVSVLTNDATFIQETLGVLMPALVRHLPIVVIGGLALTLLNWQLTLALALSGFPMVVTVWLYGRAMRSITHRGQNSIAEVGVVAQESFAAIRFIKSLTREAYFIQRFMAHVNALFKIKQRRVLWQSAMEGVLPLAIAWTALFGIWVSRGQLEVGQATTVQIATYITYLVVAGASLAPLVRA